MDRPAYGVIANDSAPNTYQVNSLVIITATFTAADGTSPADPTAVALYVQSPDGIETVYSGSDITRRGVGSYLFNLVVKQPGSWIYKWQGVGAVVITSADIYFRVAQTVFSDFITPTPPGSSGQPIGLLLALTQA